MDPAAIKAEAGDRLCFLGGVDAQHLLPAGRPEQVREEVCRRIRELGPGGGYILAPSHNIGDDVPLENILAFFDGGAYLRRLSLISSERAMTSELTSRERVRLALNHQEPDRVPIDITWTKVPIRRCPARPGPARRGLEARRVGSCQAGPGCDRAPQRRLHLGRRCAGRSTRPPFSFDMDEWTDEWGVTFRKVTRPDQGDQFEIHDWPLKEPSARHCSMPTRWPDPLDPARYEGVADQVRHLYETTDYALCGRLGDSVWEQGNYSAGQAQWLMYVATNPDFCQDLMARAAAIQKQVYLEGLRHIGKYLSVIRLGGEDFGIQTGMLISPRAFRSLVKPILKDVYMAVKERLADMGNYDCKLMLHSCGAVASIIPDLIEIGVDVLDPVQTRAKGMNALVLKESLRRPPVVPRRIGYTGRLALWHGGRCGRGGAAQAADVRAGRRLHPLPHPQLAGGRVRSQCRGTCQCGPGMRPLPHCPHVRARLPAQSGPLKTRRY